MRHTCFQLKLSTRVMLQGMPTTVTGKWDTNDQIAFFWGGGVGIYFTIFMAGRGDL